MLSARPSTGSHQRRARRVSGGAGALSDGLPSPPTPPPPRAQHERIRPFRDCLRYQRIERSGVMHVCCAPTGMSG